MASETFEARMERACRDLEIPGAVLVGGDKEGKFRYERAFGNRSLKDSKPDPMQLDATMWLASCTKLVTTVAVMQCVEKGLLKLDDDVTTILPELKGIKILKGFETGEDGKDKPILVKSEKTITLRHLLTHTSGLSYDVFSPTLQRFRATQGFTPSLHVAKPILDAMSFPLLFEPGESWEYGVGIDWAGWMVERITRSVNLEEYCQKNIWDRLGVKSWTYFPKKNPACFEKFTDMSERAGGINMFGTPADPEGKVAYTDNLIWNLDTPGYGGGAGSYSAPLDYEKLLHSILSDDENLLKKTTVDEMFKTDHCTEASTAAFMQLLQYQEVNDSYVGLPLGTKVTYGLGGAIILEDLPGRRRKGTMAWGGYPNLIWFIDRVGGMAGIYGSQICFPGDPKTIALMGLWEKELYRKGGKEKL